MSDIISKYSHIKIIFVRWSKNSTRNFYHLPKKADNLSVLPTVPYRLLQNFVAKNIFYPHTPVAQKVANEVVFRRFQGEGVD